MKVSTVTSKTSNNPAPVQNVYETSQNVTPDLTPLDKALHQQLADMNKVESVYTIKKKTGRWCRGHVKCPPH